MSSDRATATKQNKGTRSNANNTNSESLEGYSIMPPPLQLHADFHSDGSGKPANFVIQQSNNTPKNQDADEFEQLLTKLGPAGVYKVFKKGGWPAQWPSIGHFHELVDNYYTANIMELRDEGKTNYYDHDKLKPGNRKHRASINEWLRSRNEVMVWLIDTAKNNKANNFTVSYDELNTSLKNLIDPKYTGHFKESEEATNDKQETTDSTTESNESDALKTNEKQQSDSGNIENGVIDKPTAEGSKNTGLVSKPNAPKLKYWETPIQDNPQNSLNTNDVKKEEAQIEGQEGSDLKKKQAQSSSHNQIPESQKKFKEKYGENWKTAVEGYNDMFRLEFHPSELPHIHTINLLYQTAAKQVRDKIHNEYPDFNFISETKDYYTPLHIVNGHIVYFLLHGHPVDIQTIEDAVRQHFKLYRKPRSLGFFESLWKNPLGRY